MRFKGTYLLAVLFLAFVAYVYLYEVRGERERQKAEEEQKKVLIFDKGDISRMYIENYDTTFTFEKGPDGWEMKSPVETKAEDNQIDLVLTSIQNADIERVVEDSAADLATYGLDDPLVKLQIGTESTLLDTICLGHHNPTQSFVYARLSGQRKVLLLPQTIFSNASKKVLAFRDKSVMDFEKDDVTRMTIKRKDDTLVFERVGDKWFSREPISARADRGKVERVINGMVNLKAREFVSEGDENLSMFGLDDPWGRIDLVLKGDLGTESLILGNAREKGDVLVKDVSRKPVVLVPPHIVTLINAPMTDFRDKKVLAFDRNEVTEIRLAYPDRKIVSEKDPEGEWYLYSEEEPVRYRGDGESMEKLVSDLYNLLVEEFVGEKGSFLAPYGLDEPQVVVRIVEEGGELAVLTIGRKGVEEIDGKKKEYCYAMNEDDSWIFTVKGDVLDKFVLSIEDLEYHEDTEPTEED